MPSKTIVVSETKYPDIGLVEFVFLHDGKKYRVLPKDGAGDRLEAFLKFVKYVCPKSDVSPFSFKDWKKWFDVTRVDGPSEPPKTPQAPQKPPKAPKKPPEAEQMSLKLARKMEILSSELQERGLGRVAEMLKSLAMRFRKSWMGPQSIGFFDDLSNAGIQPEVAMAVLDAYEGGAAEGAQVSDLSGVEEPVCVKVIGLAKKHLLNP